MIDLVYILLGIVVLPGIIFALWAQARVQNVYKKYATVFSMKGIPANKMARAVLDASGLQHVEVVSVKGHLNDHYDPRKKRVALSHENYDSSSLSALGVAAHEVGHALQHHKHYKPLKLRGLFIGLSNFASWMLIPLIITGILLDAAAIGGVLSGYWVLILGGSVFLLAAVLNLVTLPVEFNASKRTYEILVTSDLLSEEEYEEVKKVLNAAALTYVAALVVSLLQLLRFALWALMTFGKNRK